jgi:uncharacterized protein
MLERSRLFNLLNAALERSRVVALLGPRQAGKTTLARRLAENRDGAFFDLEDETDLARLSAPKEALAPLRGLVVLDEIQFRPDLLPLLRVLADRQPLPARFLILGSASPDLIRGASESLAGRVEFVDIGGFELEDTGREAMSSLWARGGFPLSFLAHDDQDSFAWRMAFVRTFLERDLRRFGIEAPPEAIGRLWKMLAHYHGGIWNAAEFGRSLGVTSQTSRRHLDILSRSFMVRALPPWFENLGKRLVRHPKVYLRDSGILHALLGLAGLEDVRGHPKCGASWEGFCLEQILLVAGERDAYFWGTHAGAELDLLLVRGTRRIGFEFKYADAPRRTRSMEIARTDLRLTELYVVYPGEASYSLGDGIEVVPLPEMLRRMPVSPGS